VVEVLPTAGTCTPPLHYVDVSIQARSYTLSWTRRKAHHGGHGAACQCDNSTRSLREGAFLHAKAQQEEEWSNAKPWNKPTQKSFNVGETYSFGLQFALADSLEHASPTESDGADENDSNNDNDGITDSSSVSTSSSSSLLSSCHSYYLPLDRRLFQGSLCLRCGLRFFLPFWASWRAPRSRGLWPTITTVDDNCLYLKRDDRRQWNCCPIAIRGYTYWGQVRAERAGNADNMIDEVGIIMCTAGVPVTIAGKTGLYFGWKCLPALRVSLLRCRWWRSIVSLTCCEDLDDLLYDEGFEGYFRYFYCL